MNKDRAATQIAKLLQKDYLEPRQIKLAYPNKSNLGLNKHLNFRHKFNPTQKWWNVRATKIVDDSTKNFKIPENFDLDGEGYWLLHQDLGWESLAKNPDNLSVLWERTCRWWGGVCRTLLEVSINHTDWIKRGGRERKREREREILRLLLYYYRYKCIIDQ